MELFLKGCGAVLLTVILILTLGNRAKDLSMVLLTGVCCMVALVALEYIKPILDFLRHLTELGGIDGTMVSILLKAAGIGFLVEISALICNDAGSSSLGKGIQFLGSFVILWLSIPMFRMLLDLLQKILGEL